MSPRVLAIVCANGLGHFRRTIGILDRLQGVALTVACAGWAWSHTERWLAASRVRARCATIDGVTEPGVGWSLDPARYDDGRLLSWTARLAALPELERADLVLSDNLAGVLSLRPDAVLLGSFLWSDVLEHAYGERAAVRAFVEEERALCSRFAPPMLCVGPIAMPGVLARTQAVALPWMCEGTFSGPRASLPPVPRVLVMGGATGSADAVLGALDAGVLGASVERARFGGEEVDLSSVDLVVARPGVGTITACIAARVPLVLAYEGGNLELAHNAARLASLGVAIDAGADAPRSRVMEAVQAALSPAEHAAMSSRMAALPCDGLARAADWISARLGHRSPSG